MIVNNITDSYISEKSRRDWLEYWLHFSKKKPKCCSEVNCTATHTYGMLVHKQFEDEQIFVIPLCKAHSENFTSQLEIDDDTEVIEANLTL
jgi:hypothetical protein